MKIRLMSHDAHLSLCWCLSIYLSVCLRGTVPVCLPVRLCLCISAVGCSSAHIIDCCKAPHCFSTRTWRQSVRVCLTQHAAHTFTCTVCGIALHFDSGACFRKEGLLKTLNLLTLK